MRAYLQTYNHPLYFTDNYFFILQKTQKKYTFVSINGNYNEYLKENKKMTNSNKTSQDQSTLVCQGKKLNKYLIKWTTSIDEFDRDEDDVIDSYQTTRSTIIFAANEDDACDIWVSQHPEAEKSTGMDSVTLVVEHIWFSQDIKIMMVGEYLKISCKQILRKYAEDNAPKYTDIDTYIALNALPAFKNDMGLLLDYVRELPWSWIARNAERIVEPRCPKEQEEFFKKESKIEATIKPYNSAFVRCNDWIGIHKHIECALGDIELSPEEKAIYAKTLRYLECSLKLLTALRDNRKIFLDQKLTDLNYGSHSYYIKAKDGEYECVKHECENFDKFLVEVYGETCEKLPFEVEKEISAMDCLISKAVNHLIKK